MPIKKSSVFIVMAAFNEENSIARVINGLKKSGYSKIVVVDDGSGDRTYSAASKTGVYVLKHIINRGQGAALQTGIAYALLKGADYIVTFDADGQHKVGDIEPSLMALRKAGVEVALGSRFLRKDSNTPFIRQMILKAGVIVTWMLYGIKLTDSHNGFRVFSRKAAQKIDITSDRMEHASQIVEQIHSKRIPFIEVPVTITYSDYSRGKGQSSANSIRIGLKMIFRKLFN